MFLSNFFSDFFQFLTWKLLLKKNCCFQFLRSTLVAVHTMQQTVSIQLLIMLFRIPSFCFLVKLFWQQGKSHFYSWLKKMKHSREFVLTKSLKAWISTLKVAETMRNERQTLFGLHVKHNADNESSKGLTYCSPDPVNQETLWSYRIRLLVKGKILARGISAGLIYS